MLSHVARRFRGAPGKISFLSPDIVDFPTEGFLKAASDQNLVVYGDALYDDIQILSAKYALLREEMELRHPLMPVLAIDPSQPSLAVAGDAG